MRKYILLLVFFSGLTLTSSTPLWAQESSGQSEVKADQDADTMKWKLINTGIFAVLVGYAVMMWAPKFFQARSFEIQKAIKDATGLKIEADFRYSEIDKKMSNLSGAVARMRAEAAAEIEREHQRMKQETAQEIEHLGRNADAEIDFLRSEGALQVKRNTAQLALALAERRLQSHFAQNDGQNGISEFVDIVAGGRKN